MDNKEISKKVENEQDQFNPAMVAGNYAVQIIASNGAVLKTYIVNNARVVVGAINQQSVVSEIK